MSKEVPKRSPFAHEKLTFSAEVFDFQIVHVKEKLSFSAEIVDFVIVIGQKKFAFLAEIHDLAMVYELMEIFK